MKSIHTYAEGVKRCQTYAESTPLVELRRFRIRLTPQSPYIDTQGFANSQKTIHIKITLQLQGLAL